MDPTAKPTAIGPPFSGQVKVVAELPPGLNKFIETNETSTTNSSISETTSSDTTIETTTSAQSQPSQSLSTEKAEVNITISKESLSQPALDLNLDLRVDIYEAAAKLYKEKIEMSKCSVCEKDEKEGYTNTENFVCTSCFESDKLPENTKKEDYTKKIVDENKKDESWTEQEELLLLEGLEMYPKNWQDIAEHVSTRTRDECILHYLKLPTADPRIDEQVKELGLLNFDQKDHVNNPIMSVVAFLAANVNPQVAASSIHQQSEIEQSDTPMESQSETLEAVYELIRTKVSQFTSRMEEFEAMESIVDEQRRQLEREKFLIREEHLSIRNRMDTMYHIMFQRRQAKILQEQQSRMAVQVVEEPIMPLDVLIKLPTEPMTPEERAFQDELRLKYPSQYLRRQHELAASRQASLPLAPPSISQ